MSSQITVPAASRSVITATPRTTFQVGTYNALTDTFTKTLDLNDHVNYWLVSADLPQPKKVYSRSTTIRAPGERIANWNYQNRHITLTIQLLYEAGTQALLAAVRALLSAIENPPYRLAFAAPNSTVLTYADVVAVSHTIPYDGKQILAQTLSKITIDFECAPGLSGDRITLSNLVVNPGFEAPSGPGIGVFADSFPNANAYSVSGGSVAVGTPSANYNSIVNGDSPYHYFRLDDSTTTATDSKGNGNGTYTGGYTQGLSSALSSDADACVSFNGSTGYINGSAAGLAFGNGAWSLECWVNVAAYPSSGYSYIIGYGNNATKSNPLLYINASGALNVTGFGWGDTGGKVLALNQWYHIVGTWDGTNMRCYVNGVQQGATTTPGAMTTTATTLFLGGGIAGGSYLNGRVDEAAFYNGALSASQVANHYNAGRSNALSFTSNAQITFGSPSWGPINQYRVRFQWAGVTFNAYWHFIDGNNSLFCNVAPSGLQAVHDIGGASHTLASAPYTLAAGSWYWLVLTQYPTAPQAQAALGMTLYSDVNGQPGSSLASNASFATFDGVTALSGKMAILAGNGGDVPLVIGGGFANTHVVNLFGPGGWTFTGANGGTSIGSGAWDQNTSNTYPGGPVTSYGAARIDFPPAGTMSAYWESYSGGVAPAGTSAIPTTTGQVMRAAAYVKSSGLSGSATLTLQVREWDANGAFLRSTTLQTLNGNQSSWTALAGSATMGATTAYCSVLLLAVDTTTGSVNGTVWFENAQCWNQTTTGQSSMPYCELRFPQSPAQLLVTGLQGDMAAPALMDYGTYIPTSYSGFTTLTLTVGQRATPQAAGKLVYVPAISPGPGAAMALDSTVYGGCYGTTVGTTNGIPSDPLTPTEAALLGLFHELIWVKPKDTAYASQTVQLNTQELLTASIGGQVFSNYNGPALNLGASAAVWLPVDAGMLPIPFSAPIQREDYTQKWFGLSTTVNVNSTSGNPTGVGPIVLLPVDGGLSRVLLQNVTAPLASEVWCWVYNDGPLAAPVDAGQGAASGGGWRFSLESTPLPNPAHAAGGVGANAIITLQPVADSYLAFDPTNSGGAGGVPIAQLVAYLKDGTNGLDGTMPLYAEAQYTPLYLYPRQS